MNDHLDVADVDNIAFRLECGVRMFFSVHLHLEGGLDRAEDVAPAVFGAYDYLSALVQELRQLIDGNPADKKEVTA